MKEILKALFNAILWAVLLILVFLVSSSIYQRIAKTDEYKGFFGIGYAVVVSGSMRPVFQVDDVILYQERQPDEYRVGDIIVYVRKDEADEMLITHRIVRIDGDELVTKGDANETEDKPIKFDDVVGRVVWLIPSVGKAVGFLKTVPGMITAAAVVVLFIVLNVLLSIRVKRKVKTATGTDYIRY